MDHFGGNYCGGYLGMSKQSKITSKELKKLLHYDPSTGEFTWIVTQGSANVGDKAGTIAGQGYLQICINRKRYLTHRLAWLYIHGLWPKNSIDHIDGNPVNNKISNLREATHSQNCQNRGMTASNTSGYCGVSLTKDRKKWRAQIRIQGQKKYLGTFDTPQQAHEAYCEAGQKHHGRFFNSGEPKALKTEGGSDV